MDGDPEWVWECSAAINVAGFVGLAPLWGIWPLDIITGLAPCGCTGGRIIMTIMGWLDVVLVIGRFCPMEPGGCMFG